MLGITATIKQNIWARELVKICVGVILLFACGQLYIPLDPVMISLQTVGLMIIAVLYDMRGGLAVVLAYITAGILGVPVFAEYHAGPLVLVGTTGGYLIGFLPCVYVMNQLKAVVNMNKAWGIFANCLVGTAVIFAFGISWLSYLIGIKAAFWGGFVPFIIPGLIKAMMLTAFLRSIGVLRNR